jgi:hypothetical protein
MRTVFIYCISINISAFIPVCANLTIIYNVSLTAVLPTNLTRIKNFINHSKHPTDISLQPSRLAGPARIARFLVRCILTKITASFSLFLCLPNALPNAQPYAILQQRIAPSQPIHA